MIAVAVIAVAGCGREQSAIELFRQGVRYTKGQGVAVNQAEAVKYYRQAAEKGLPEAQFNLGLCYSDGLGIEVDKFEAEKWFRKAAEKGQVQAKYCLAIIYRDGETGKKDLTESAKLLSEAAWQGYAPALTRLGAYAFHGIGEVKKNRPLAVELFRKAAIQGDSEAQYYLGLCYRDGEGVAQNQAEAEKWLRRAVKKGSTEAKQALSLLTQ